MAKKISKEQLVKIYKTARELEEYEKTVREKQEIDDLRIFLGKIK